ncbi:porin family protein [Mangrovibacterium diazotrophicum]|uniref:Outer membrane protein with beta-barrel domain n=1 Tax=Mangrovibacterium diazotrophicum TaxID=1261403 RepID=A0A419WBI1_9BACT|nr:porin family protein [Mangrovibacterium diazotrophicum]RKD92825.1 outer membrane protein with beta-barrel domain [Mangrovibacterium diazotrophicum]
MKRNFSLLVLLLFLSATSFAQEKFALAFTASPTINWMSAGASEINNNKSTLGYEFGVNGDFYFDQEMRYAFATGVLISQTGGELTYNTQQDFNFGGETFAPGTSIRYRMKYIEIPVGLKLRTNQFYRWTYWGLFGLYGAVNVGDKGDSSDGLLDKADINKEVKLFNAGLNIGIGAEYDLGERNSLILGLTYKDGFTDVTKHGLGEKTTVNSLTFKFGLVF